MLKTEKSIYEIDSHHFLQWSSFDRVIKQSPVNLSSQARW